MRRFSVHLIIDPAMHGCRLIGWIVVSCLLFSGCEIGRTMFQMDSNSGQPFFGVDLLRSRKTAEVARPKSSDSSAEVTPVRNSAASMAPPQATAAPKSTEPSLLERLKLKRPPERIALTLPAAEAEAAEGPVEEFR